MRSILLSVLTLVVATSSFAESRRVAEKKNNNPPPVIAEGTHYNIRHEILLNIGEFFQNNYSNATLSFNNNTRIGFGGNYFYRINQFLQVGPRLSLNYINLGTTSLTNFEILAAARINFPFDHDIENAFFGGLLVGFGTTSLGVTGGTGTSQSAAVFAFEAGKRFLLFPNFTWQPTFVLNIPTNSGYGAVALQFRLLTASVMF